MRGIAGTLALRTGTKLDVAEVRTMLGALRHRGASVCSLTNRPGSIFASCGGEADVFDEQPSEIPANAPAVVLDGMLFGDGSASSLLPHNPANFTRRIAELWETDQERMPRLLRGQFAFALRVGRRFGLLTGRRPSEQALRHCGWRRCLTRINRERDHLH